ncbi:unnamed protein product [Symbiodinium sp. CCMP2456]|nr:unnamed protein product [Symbiodinium sp. CCMP2456]
MQAAYGSLLNADLWCRVCRCLDVESFLRFRACQRSGQVSVNFLEIVFPPSIEKPSVVAQLNQLLEAFPERQLQLRCWRLAARLSKQELIDTEDAILCINHCDSNPSVVQCVFGLRRDRGFGSAHPFMLEWDCEDDAAVQVLAFHSRCNLWSLDVLDLEQPFTLRFHLRIPGPTGGVHVALSSNLKPWQGMAAGSCDAVTVAILKRGNWRHACDVVWVRGAMFGTDLALHMCPRRRSPSVTLVGGRSKLRLSASIEFSRASSPQAAPVAHCPAMHASGFFAGTTIRGMTFATLRWSHEATPKLSARPPRAVRQHPSATIRGPLRSNLAKAKLVVMMSTHAQINKAKVQVTWRVSWRDRRTILLEGSAAQSCRLPTSWVSKYRGRSPKP